MKKTSACFIKKTTLVCAILLGAAFSTGCHKDKDTKVFTVITPSFGNTKDYIADTIVYWNDNDALRINDGVYAIAVESGDRHKATVNAEGATAINGNYYAAYPANISTIAANGQITFDLPAEEIYTTSGGRQVIHSVMAAVSNEENIMKFQNVCALLHFKVNASGSGIGAKLHSVEVESDQPMCGTLTSNYNESTSKWNTTLTVPDGNKRTMRFATPLTLSSSLQDVYLIVPPVSGATTFTMRMTVEDADGTVKVFEKTRTGEIIFENRELYNFTDANTYTGSVMKYGGADVSPNTMDGTEDHPYLVYSSTSWSHIATNAIMGDADNHITLASDIDASSTFANDFKATLDGNGHKITLTTQNISLFYTINGGTVKNLTIAATNDVTTPEFVYNGSYCYGALAGIAKENATLDNCTNLTNITCDRESSSLKVGGLIGLANGCTLKKCTNRGSINSNSLYVGGIVGETVDLNSFSGCSNYGTITTTSSSGTVKTQYLGGIAGHTDLSDNSGYATDCHNYGDIVLQKASASTTYIGGVFGRVNCNISGCSNEGNIACNNTGSNTKYVGGVVGGYTNISSLSTMLNCSNTGNITAVEGKASMTAAGLLGTDKNMAIKNCFAFCTIQGNTVAGIAAKGSDLFSNVSISNCYFYGTLTGTNKYGIAGASSSSFNFQIDHCYHPENTNLCGNDGDNLRDNNTLSSAIAISGVEETSLSNALNDNIANMPTGSYGWENSTDNSHVVFNIPESKTSKR